MQLHAANGRLVVKPTEAKKKTDGGIVLPENHEVKVNTGSVLSSGVERYPNGTMVLFSEYGGSPVELNGHRFLVLHEDDVLATITE